MASLDRPMGFRPVTNGPAGTAPQIGYYSVSSTLATAIFEGDLCYLSKTGPHALLTLGGTADSIHNIIGVAANYVAATPGAGVELAIYDDPLQRYEVQADDNTLDTAAEVKEAIGQYFAVTPTAGNTTTLQSKMELDSDTGTSVRDEDTILQVVKLADGIDNVLVSSGSWTRFVVQLTKECHKFTSNTLTVLT